VRPCLPPAVSSGRTWRETPHQSGPRFAVTEPSGDPSSCAAGHGFSSASGDSSTATDAAIYIEVVTYSSSSTDSVWPTSHNLHDSFFGHTVDTFSSRFGAPVDDPEPFPEPSPEQPDSWGSAGHESGECCPCVWFHTKRGCAMGAACGFCHLCDKDAFKRKKAAFKRKKREDRRQAKALLKTVAAPHHAQPASASHPQPPQQQQQQQQQQIYDQQHHQQQPPPQPYRHTGPSSLPARMFSEVRAILTRFPLRFRA